MKSRCVEYGATSSAWMGSWMLSFPASICDRFDPKAEPGEVSAYVRRVRSQLERSKLLTDRIQWVGTLDHDEYAWILGAAQFLFHPSLIDGGTLAAAEAAGLGVPTLSNDYPPMRFYDQELRLEISFFDGIDENAIASALKDAEEPSDRTQAATADSCRSGAIRPGQVGAVVVERGAPICLTANFGWASFLGMRPSKASSTMGLAAFWDS